jgi:hypothetical protein
VTSEIQHVLPPTAESLRGLIVTTSPLAEKLGIGVRLAAEHLADTDDARSVLAWLREIGAVIDDTGDEEVIRRLAVAGRAGNQLAEVLTDDQLRSLRDAFEQMIPAQRATLGHDVAVVGIARAPAGGTRGVRTVTSGYGRGPMTEPPLTPRHCEFAHAVHTALQQCGLPRVLQMYAQLRSSCPRPIIAEHCQNVSFWYGELSSPAQGKITNITAYEVFQIGNLHLAAAWI